MSSIQSSSFFFTNTNWPKNPPNLWQYKKKFNCNFYSLQKNLFLTVVFEKTNRTKVFVFSELVLDKKLIFLPLVEPVKSKVREKHITVAVCKNGKNARSEETLYHQNFIKKWKSPGDRDWLEAIEHIWRLSLFSLAQLNDSGIDDRMGMGIGWTLTRKAIPEKNTCVALHCNA